MAAFYLKWIGKAVGVNMWKDYRMVPNKYYNPKKNPKSRPYMVIVYKTPEYRGFMESLSNAMRGVTLEGYFDLSIKMSLWKVKDTDGPVKAIMDALEDSGVLKNDKHIRNLRVIRAYHHRDEKDIVIVELFRAKHQDVSWAGKRDLFSESPGEGERRNA